MSVILTFSNLHISYSSRYASQVLGVFQVGINWNGIRHFAMLLVHLVLRQVFANTKEIEAEALKEKNILILEVYSAPGSSVFLTAGKVHCSTKLQQNFAIQIEC